MIIHILDRKKEFKARSSTICVLCYQWTLIAAMSDRPIHRPMSLCCTSSGKSKRGMHRCRPARVGYLYLLVK
jgi:hypothetical protein